MSRIWMDEARILDDGKERVVQLPGDELRGENIHYDPLHHKGALKCRFCDAAVHFHKGAKRICGDNLAGPSAHFHTNRGQIHDPDCKWPERKLEREAKEYDDSKGYKIHLNMEALRGLFNRQAGSVYVREAGSKVIGLVPDLQGRFPKSISSLSDVVDLMKEGDFERLGDSVVVHRDHIVPWKYFLVRHDYRGEKGQSRFGDLVRGLQMGQSGPCLMEVFNHKVSHHGRRRESLPIHWYTDEREREHMIVPVVWLENLDSQARMQQQGRYLVLGYPRHFAKATRDRKVFHYLNMSVQNSEQVLRASLPEISRAAKENRENRRLHAFKA